MKEVLAKAESKMNKTIQKLENDYAAIRAGRANPSVLDKVTVDYYGAPTPVNQLASVSVTEARVLRKEIVKDVSRMAEDAKVALRSIRRDAIEKLKAMKKEGELTEDDLKQAEKKAQDITDKSTKAVDKCSEAKQKEVITL